MKKKVIVIGGGFAGIKVAQGLKKADVDLLVLDKTNHHLFQPLLYQVATAAISSSNIAAPIREILRKQKNATVLMSEVISIDKENKFITLLDGKPISYDYLVVATGSIPSYFGNNEWTKYSHGLKTLTDAIKIRDHILYSYEMAEKCDNYEDAKKYLRFVVIGGGPTGVEMAGALAEIAKTSLFNRFRKIRSESSEIYLIEGSNLILPSYPLDLCERAKKDLEKMGVRVLTNTKVNNINSEGVHFGDTFLETANVIWAAGNEASPLLKSLNSPLDRQGRLFVQPDLSVPGHPDVFVIGDAASVSDVKWGTLPGVAPVAMQQGKYVANLITKKISKENRKPFKYFDKGSMATIGKDKAIATVGKFHFTGRLAWLSWSFIHIAYLISFRNRFIVMAQWIFWYITGRRNVCIINRSVDEIKNDPNDFYS